MTYPPLPPAYFDTFAALAIVFAAAASINDLKSRIIPDWLNYGSLVVAVAAALLAGRLDASYAAFVAAAFAFSWLLYKLGVWAGGDVKFFTAISAWFGLLKSTSPLLIVGAFTVSAILALPVAMACYHDRIWAARKTLSP